jgi:tripartite tricarboxylate transporter TctB family protein
MTLTPSADGHSGAASPWREAALGLVFLAVGIVLYVLARAIELPQRPTAVSPRIWPEILGIGIMALSVLQIVTAFVTTPAPDENEPAIRLGVLRVVGFVLAIVAFGMLWYYVHFLASGSLLVAGLAWIAGGRGVKDLVLFPAVITVVLYALFALLLKVPI